MYHHHHETNIIFLHCSVRRTAISQLLTEGYHETKVQQLSGHKNIQSLNSYRSNSFAQQKQMSSTLSATLTKPTSFQTIDHSTFQAIASIPQPMLGIEPPQPMNQSLAPHLEPQRQQTISPYPEPQRQQAMLPISYRQDQRITMPCSTAAHTPSITDASVTSFHTSTSISLSQTTSEVSVSNQVLDDDFLMDLLNDPFSDVSSGPVVPSVQPFPQLPQSFQNCTFNGPVTFNFQK